MPTTRPIQSAIRLEVGGAPVNGDLMATLVSADISKTYNRAASCVLQLSTAKEKKLDGAITVFAVGKEIHVKMKKYDTSTNVPVFAGEITSIELEFDGVDTVLVVHAHDLLHRLYRTERTVNHLKKKTSDIASTIAAANGLTASAEATTYQHPAIVQYRETDGDFLARLLAESGQYFYGDNKKLVTKKFDTATPEIAVDIKDLEGYRVGASSSSIVKTVEVVGWDDVQKKEVLGKAVASPAPTTLPHLAKNGADKGLVHVVRQGDATYNETIAKSLLARINTPNRELSGTFHGARPDIQVGSQIKLEGAHKDLNGTYRVSAVHHHHAVTGTSTEFECRGPDDQSFASLVARTAGAELAGAMTRPFSGAATGIVTSIKDEDGDRGRVRVRFPQLEGAQDSDWLRVVFPGGGPKGGMYLMPDVNDEVLVVFGGEDPRAGFVIGGLYNGKDAPPMAKADVIKDGVVDRHVFQTRKGAYLYFENEKDAFELAAASKNITFRFEEGKGLTLTNKGNGNIVEINAEGDVTILSKGNIEIKADKDLKIDAMNIKMNAQSNIEMKATSNLKMEGTSGAEMKGMTAKVEGQTKAEVTAPNVSIAGTAMTEVKGGLVKIN